MKTIALPAIAHEIMEARCHDPFAYLGRQPASGGGIVIRAFKPSAKKLSLIVDGGKRAQPTPAEW